VNPDDLEHYEADLEGSLYHEYKEVHRLFSHVVETERRFYLANDVSVEVCEAGGRSWFQIDLEDAWVWDMYRQNRFVSKVRVITFKDVNVEDLPEPDLDIEALRRKSG
jgi:hypothetical protein